LPALPDAAATSEPLIQLLQEKDQIAWDQPTSADATGDLGNVYHANSLRKKAQHCYELANELDPKDWRWLYYQALLAIEQSDADASTKLLESVVALHQDYATAWYRLAQLRAKSGNSKAAIDAYLQAIKSNKGGKAKRVAKLRGLISVSAYAGLGMVRLKISSGDKSGAKLELEKLVLRYPRFGGAHRLLGQLAGEMGDQSAKFIHLGKADRLPPFSPPRDPLEEQLVLSCRDVDQLILRASVANRSGQKEFYMILCMRALEFDPGNLQTMLYAAIALRTNGRAAEAIKLLNRRLKKQEDVSNTLMELAGCYEQINQLPKAEQLIRRALKISDTNIKSRAILAMNLISQRKLAQAATLSRQLLKEDPNLAEAHAALGGIAYLQADYVAAALHMQRTLVLSPYAWQAREILAKSMMRLGHYAQALKVLNQTLLIEPDNQEAGLTIAWLRATCPIDDIRDGKEAVRLAQKFGRMDVRSLEVLAAAYAEVGSFDNAVSTAKKAQALVLRAGQAEGVRRLDSQMATYQLKKPVRDQTGK
jgi:tetratricopeptide (TPR) repeat protein